MSKVPTLILLQFEVATVGSYDSSITVFIMCFDRLTRQCQRSLFLTFSHFHEFSELEFEKNEKNEKTKKNKKTKISKD